MQIWKSVDSTSISGKSVWKEDLNKWNSIFHLSKMISFTYLKWHLSKMILSKITSFSCLKNHLSKMTKFTFLRRDQLFFWFIPLPNLSNWTSFCFSWNHLKKIVSQIVSGKVELDKFLRNFVLLKRILTHLRHCKVTCVESDFGLWLSPLVKKKVK